jgi:hypothetical protein
MGIGNMMFAFASSLGIAKSKGMDLIVKKSKLTNSSIGYTTVNYYNFK